MVSVPERFFQDFDSEFPSLATLQDATLSRSLVFGRAAVGNVVKFTAWEAARRIEAINIPGNLAEPAQIMFDSVGAYLASAQSMEQLVVPDVLLNTADNFAAMASAMGAFDSVPIVGMILDFALTIADGVLTTYRYKHSQAIEAFPMGYDRERDQDWTRQALRLHGGDDLTALFLPVNDASDGVDKLNTEIDSSGLKDEITRAIYVPLGPGTGNIGGLPNTPAVPKGWEWNLNWNPRTRPTAIPWSAFMPSTTQAVLQSWQSVLSNSRACYLVDAVEVADAWAAWQFHMKLWGWGTRYSGDDRVRIAAMSRPPVDYATQQRIGADGFRTIVPFWPGSGMSKGPGTQGSKPYYGPLLGDVGRWAAEVQLGRRQRKYLGTLTVAYCSEDDPAFRSDPELADLLVERRRLLLEHEDVVHVDLSQVVDTDYRSALATRQGPKGLATPTNGGPGIGGIAARPPEQTTMPPVIVSRMGAATPFLGRRARSTSGLGNLLVLAMLGVLVR